MSRLFISIICLAGCLLLCVYCQPGYSPEAAVAAHLPATVDFNYHIKPILSDRCFACHGPDDKAREADLRLHTSEGALRKALSSGRRAFAPGNLRRSEAFQRMTSVDPEQKMPPPDFERGLSAYEIALIAKWIEQGAEYKPHWAFIPPRKPPLPKVQARTWCANEIDHFVLKKLEEKGLSPKEHTDRERLLRRATLDLTGLPPTLEEIDDFLADRDPDAYEKVVDRLLASPHYGERMALFWLDLARYADSNGYSQDGLRIMWPWRDWVIKAFNENMPYDRFVAWQIAGDKLPQATQEQRLATGFLRNHRLNGEGGIIDEEYRVEYAADRTETTAAVFLGMTMQCARCHDHKYDPISQEEYYRFYSFFNNVHESGVTADDDNSGPELVLTPKEVAAQIAFIDRAIEARKREAEQIAAAVPPASYLETKVDLNRDLLVNLSFDRVNEGKLPNEVDPGEEFSIGGDFNPVPGAIGQGMKFTAFDIVRLSKEQLDFDRADAFSFSFYLKSDLKHPSIGILKHLGGKPVNFPGYEVALVDGYPTIHFAHSRPAVVLEVRGTQRIDKDAWTHIVFAYDGSGQAAGIDLFVNGERQETKIVFDKLTQGFANRGKTLTIGGRTDYQTEVDGYGFIDELKIYGRRVSALEAAALSGARRDFSEQERKAHFLVADHQQYQSLWDTIRELRRRKFQAQDTLVSVMVMEDLPEPRPTFVLDRGVYDAPGKQVFPGTPQAILPFSAEAAPDRSGLVRWLFDENNPLTARVAVNRFWQLLFGRGIVKTTEDFGNQGELPSHPALLDWLAVHFQESGWDVKALLKMIVMSSAYRQSSRAAASEREADPDNTWLARGPSRRLSAELLRDGALAAGGLLTRRIGGPSVKPYQPPGLWEEKGEFTVLKQYQQDSGANLYRRSLYTFWRRTSPPPAMTTFDAPTRDVCIVSRQETNTPLQALVLLNDPQFVEAARVLAERVVRAERQTPDRIERAHRLLTGLRPRPEVLRLLVAQEQRERERFVKEPEKARDLLSVGEYPADGSLSPAEAAAMTVVCSTMMSFDETVVKR